jgi:molybdopterin-guanine dinucleotide biosynthesis protein A
MRFPANSNPRPVGVILAGGPGARIGGGKPSVALHGEALLRYPLRAMKRALHDVAVITKADITLPPLDGAMVWIEPERPVHPLLGICEALALAGGRPVLACPADMPFVTAQLLSGLAGADGSHAVVLAACRGVPRPLLGRYAPSAAPLLTQAADRGLALGDVLPQLHPTLVEVDDEVQLFDVDTPADLLQAAAMMDARSVRARA